MTGRAVRATDLDAGDVDPGDVDPGPVRVVLLDARPERRQLLRHLIDSTDGGETDVVEAATPDEAVGLLGRDDRQMVIAEMQMPVSLGLETVATLRKCSSHLPIVVCSFHRDPATKERALAQGADVYLDKPVSTMRLGALLQRFFPEPPAAPGGHPPAPPATDHDPLR